MSDSVRPHRWQPTRLLCPWESPGKNTGVVKVKSESEVALVLSDSSRSHGLQPTRLLRPWDSPGKSTGVGCHWNGAVVHILMWAYIGLYYCCCCSVAKSCLTLCDSMDYSMSGLPVSHYLLKFVQVHVHWVSDAIQPGYGVSQARILELYLNKMSKLGKAIEEKVVPPQKKKKDFPDGPMAQTPHSKCRGSGLIPGGGTTFHVLQRSSSQATIEKPHA